MSTTDNSRSGEVVGFDAHSGLGDIRDSIGEVWPFHCLSIKDGSRAIDIGAKVEFVVRFHVARQEAFEIIAIQSPAAK